VRYLKAIKSNTTWHCVKIFTLAIDVHTSKYHKYKKQQPHAKADGKISGSQIHARVEKMDMVAELVKDKAQNYCRNTQGR
jgi:hypothetical protein